MIVVIFETHFFESQTTHEQTFTVLRYQRLRYDELLVVSKVLKGLPELQPQFAVTVSCTSTNFH